MKTILVVEDQPKNLRLILQVLEDCPGDFRTVTTGSGKEALAIALSTLPDLILMDIALPDMDGFSVAKKLREYSETTGIPVVAVTAYATTEDRERYRYAFDAYITKPINEDVFLETVSRFLGKEPDGHGGL